MSDDKKYVTSGLRADLEKSRGKHKKATALVNRLKQVTRGLSNELAISLGNLEICAHQIRSLREELKEQQAQVEKLMKSQQNLADFAVWALKNPAKLASLAQQLPEANPNREWQLKDMWAAAHRHLELVGHDLFVRQLSGVTSKFRRIKRELPGSTEFAFLPVTGPWSR